MKAFLVVSIAAFAGAAFGCSGYQYTNPLADGDGTTTETATLAQPDTPECLKEGSEIVAVADGGAAPVCCEGLTRAEVYKGSILRFDQCEPEGGGHAFCIRCGDGRCGVGENTCSCMADCHWP